LAKLYLLSAFSLSMIRDRGWIHLRLVELSPATAREALEAAKAKGKEIVNAIGHPATAKLVGSILGLDLEANRITVALEDEDEALVFQVMERLPEGKILSEDELWDLWNRGKLKILHVLYSTKFY